MIVNLAAHMPFDVDSAVSGTVSLTRAQLQGLVDEDYTTDVVTLSGTDILVLDVDLGNRIAVLDLRYYFDSATASGTVASGIQWYYKNYDSDPWYSLTTVAGGGYYTTTTVSGTFFPQYVRMVQTISGTGIIGSAREYEVNNDDTIVDYGSDGSQTEQYFSDSPIGTSDPVTVPVYNDGQKTATSAFVYIGNTDTDADDMLRISDASNGTYISVDDGFLIDGGANDGNSWGIGSHDDTAVTNSKLVLGSFGASESFTHLHEIPVTWPNRAVTRWHASNPQKSEVFYANGTNWRLYSLEDDTDVVRTSVPFGFGIRDRLIYDPENDKIYAFDFNNATTTFYQYDPVADSWTASLGSFSNSPVTQWPVGCLAFIPSNVLNDGARSIIAMCGTGEDGVNPTNPVRIKLTDHSVNTSWGNLTNYTREDGGDQSTAGYPVMMLTFQGENLDPFPAGTQGVLWHLQNSSYDIEYLKYFVIKEGTSDHKWHALDLSSLPRSPSTYNRQDTWFPFNNDTWFYDSANNRVWYVEDPGWQDASRHTHYFGCDGIYNRGYEEMHSSGEFTQFSYFWYDGTTNQRCYLTLDGKVYGDSVYMTCWNGCDDCRDICLYTPGGTGTYYSEGVYTSPVVKNTDPTYWRVKSEIPSGASIKTSENAVSATIEIRSSDTAPTAEDTHHVATFERGYDLADYYYPVCYNYDGSYKWGNTTDQTYGYATYFWPGAVAVNEWYPDVYNSSNSFIFFSWVNRRTGSSFNRLRFNLYNVAGGRISARWRYSHTDDNNYYRPTNAKFAKNGMIYVTYRGIGTEYDRIDVLDNNTYWSSTLEMTGDQSTLYSMCVGGDDWEDLWIIKEDENEVRRYDQRLQLQQTIENQGWGNINGICKDGEGGFFLGDQQAAYRKIWHYDVSGTLVASYDLSGHINSIHRMRKDWYGGLWILDTVGEQLARFTGDGVLVGKVSLLSPQSHSSTRNGCWVKSVVYDRHYFVDLDVNVLKQNVAGGDVPDTYDGDNWDGATAQSIDINGYLDADSLDGDTVWGSGGSLEWNEVGKDTNFVPYRSYHQSRITLRSDDGSATPEVEKLALPPAVTLYNIGPQSTKNVYLKTVVPQGTDNALRQTKIRTWFSMEE
jgi:hypothetical protein